MFLFKEVSWSKIEPNKKPQRLCGFVTEACYQKIGPLSPLASSLICLHQAEAAGNMSRLSNCWAQRLIHWNLKLTPSHTSHGGPCHGSLCGIMCKSVRWANPRPARHLMRKSGIQNWPKSQPIPEPSWPEYPTNVDRLVKRSMCASAVTTKSCLEQF